MSTTRRRSALSCTCDRVCPPSIYWHSGYILVRFFVLASISRSRAKEKELNELKFDLGKRDSLVATLRAELKAEKSVLACIAVMLLCLSRLSWVCDVCLCAMVRSLTRLLRRVLWQGSGRGCQAPER